MSAAFFFCNTSEVKKWRHRTEQKNFWKGKNASVVRARCWMSKTVCGTSACSILNTVRVWIFWIYIRFTFCFVTAPFGPSHVLCNPGSWWVELIPGVRCNTPEQAMLLDDVTLVMACWLILCLCVLHPEFWLVFTSPPWVLAEQDKNSTPASTPCTLMLRWGNTH